ncbi:MAG: tRNA uridine-5-carboxymethylaminomethyl(34) synthesis GTPase MnmE, partial [Duncaniella sp.]|nr:tRNA uridine-5-carboxymethylaminomethyl(34) synthesis GTPase MnmE [Duncaniella sp.]
MTDDNSTICAISTPPGIGGIAVARISGPRAIEITDTIWQGLPLTDAASHTAHLGTIVDAEGAILDQGVATVYRAPRSFTGENTVELSVHGSTYIQRRLIETLISAGCTLAQPGEFTRRAFAAGKMDLAEAEAIADVIASNSRAAHRIAVTQMKGAYSRRLNDLRSQLLELAALLELELDFSEEDVEFASRENLRNIASDIHAEVTRLHSSFAAGQAIKDGIPVAIVGATNAGKSSLLNTLIGDDRAIVSDIHGTTRDTIEETLETGDYLFRFIDTAGLRETDDTIEQIGIQRSRQAIDRAMITILVIDPAAPIDSTIVDSTISTDPTRH